jgi:hypothetical protein
MSGLYDPSRFGPYGEDILWLHHSPRWGFLIYRCDYRHDIKSPLFIDQWSSWVKDHLLTQYPEA